MMKPTLMRRMTLMTMMTPLNLRKIHPLSLWTTVLPDSVLNVTEEHHNFTLMDLVKLPNVGLRQPTQL
jgi:hypothetical protein